MRRRDVHLFAIFRYRSAGESYAIFLKEFYYIIIAERFAFVFIVDKFLNLFPDLSCGVTVVRFCYFL